MADKYIDNTETQKYGPELRANLQRRFGDDPRPAVRALVAWLIAEQAKADQTMADALAAHRRAKATATATSESGSPVVASTHRTLSAFYKHLDAKREDDAWSGTLETFFPSRRTGLTKGLRPLSVSLDGVVSALERDRSVPEHGAWLKKLHAAQKQLTTALADSRGAVHGARDALSEQGTEKGAWLRQYHGASLVLEGLLSLEGAQGELGALVPHMSAPGKRKPTDGKTPNVPERPLTPPIEGDTK